MEMRVRGARAEKTYRRDSHAANLEAILPHGETRHNAPICPSRPLAQRRTLGLLQILQRCYVLAIGGTGVDWCGDAAITDRARAGSRDVDAAWRGRGDAGGCRGCELGAGLVQRRVELGRRC